MYCNPTFAVQWDALPPIARTPIFLYNSMDIIHGGIDLQHWEPLCPGGLSFVYDDALFRPGTDSFLLGGFPRLRPGLRVCDLGSGTGLASPGCGRGSGSATWAAAPACWACCCSSGNGNCPSPAWNFCPRRSVWRNRPPSGTA